MREFTQTDVFGHTQTYRFDHAERPRDESGFWLVAVLIILGGIYGAVRRYFKRKSSRLETDV